jgi:hypothetical protein
MVCDPSQNNIDIGSPGGGPSLPGLGNPFSVPKPNWPDIQLPAGIPEDIIELIERFFALFPAGIKFQPNADKFFKTIWDALASLFEQIAPFLAWYKFIQALLNIILCIIDVICALLNPFATVRAVIRLFKQCLPDFLSLFPWLALILMIIALILLLIALIKYIIELIIAYIKQIIENILVLTASVQKGDADSIIAAINKLAYLLCLIEQLFALLLAVAALFAIIRPLMGIPGKASCAKGEECCTEEFCPPFIADNPTGLKAVTGRLLYYRQIGPVLSDFGSIDPILETLFSNINIYVRREKWQFLDDDPGEYKFLDIITPSPTNGFTFWPEGESFGSLANPVRVPYLLDMTIWLDPAEWGNPADIDGYRQFNIRDIIVAEKPTVLPSDQTGETPDLGGLAGILGALGGFFSGALVLLGGSVFEVTDPDSEDGYAPYMIGDSQATLETLIHKDALESNELPSDDDGENILNISYNLRPNHEVLVGKQLITSMCVPELDVEAAVFNAEYNDQRSVLEKLGDLPDIGTLNGDRTGGTGTLGCLAEALTKFRAQVNEETANTFQEEAVACLTDLLEESQDFFCRAVSEVADRFASEVAIEPDIQWIGSEIQVTATLRDKTGTQVGVGVDDEFLVACLEDILSAEVTLGEISDFVYDGYGQFIATITSEKAGEGELSVFIVGEQLADVLNRDDADVESEIVVRVTPYEFVDQSLSYRQDQGDDQKFKYGPPEIAEDGS